VRTPISPFPFLTQISDWRDPKRIKYPWETCWALILVGMLSGPENILALSQWLTGQREVLCQHLSLGSIPSQATLYRFFWQLDLHLDALHAALLAWVKACYPEVDCSTLACLSADGKVLKGSTRQVEAALSFVSVFFHELALTVAQRAQDGQHEARVLDGLLDTLQHIFGSHWLLTMDAAYTEQGLTSRIVEHGGQYLVPLKNNTKALKEWAQLAFAYPPTSAVHDEERRSGETWKRSTSTQTALPQDLLATLPDAKTLIRREHPVEHRDGRHTREVRYAVSSTLLTAQEAETLWRTHWGIENRSYHRRNTLFHEDHCRTRRGAQGRVVLHGMLLPLLHAKTRQLTAFVRQLRLNPLTALQLLGLDVAPG
jgi:predicted transposase YbfD/YdcC